MQSHESATSGSSVTPASLPADLPKESRFRQRALSGDRRRLVHGHGRCILRGDEPVGSLDGRVASVNGTAAPSVSRLAGPRACPVALWPVARSEAAAEIDKLEGSLLFHGEASPSIVVSGESSAHCGRGAGTATGFLRRLQLSAGALASENAEGGAGIGLTESRMVL